MGGKRARSPAPRHRLTGNLARTWNTRSIRAFVFRRLSDIAMTNQNSEDLPSAIDSERLLAEYRETIIKLEAHGHPEERGALWDVLGNMLADIKRQQSMSQPPDSLSR